MSDETREGISTMTIAGVWTFIVTLAALGVWG